MGTADEVTLIRENYAFDGTFGQMYFREMSVCCTCELPWNDNEPDKSCIPLGRYWVEPFSSLLHPDVWEVTGVENRVGILIHDGNTERDTLGCIVVGDSFGQLGGFDAVLNSKATVSTLRGVLPTDGFWLTVKDENQAA